MFLFQESEDEDVKKSETKKRKMQIQVKAPPSKRPHTQLKPVPRIFQQSSGTVKHRLMALVLRHYQ